MRLALILSILLMFLIRVTGQEVEISDTYRDEIKTLVANAAIQKAFLHIVNIEDETHNDLIQLTETPAPPFAEEVRGALFMKMLSAAGVDSIWTDEVGNVLGLIKGKNRTRTIALDAHLDTVFPEGTDVTVQMKGDTLYAPGVGDDTRGLAMLLSVVKSLNATKIKLKHDLLIIASVGEEGLGDLRGVKHLFNTPTLKIDEWISIDGGSLGRVNTQALGSYRYNVTFHGPGGHSWGAFGMVNPHHALGDAMNRFVDRADEFTSHGPRTSYNVGIIEGGTSVNSIPFESTMLIDVRSEVHGRLDTLEELLYLSVNEALDKQNKRKRMSADLTVTIEKIGSRPSGELSTDLPLIQRALAATAAIGKRPKITRGSTNSNIPISMNIPAVTIGRGGVGGNAHALDEWWLNKEGYKSVQLALLLTVAAAELAD